MPTYVEVNLTCVPSTLKWRWKWQMKWMAKGVMGTSLTKIVQTSDTSSAAFRRESTIGADRGRQQNAVPQRDNSFVDEANGSLNNCIIILGNYYQFLWPYRNQFYDVIWKTKLNSCRRDAASLNGHWHRLWTSLKAVCDCASALSPCAPYDSSQSSSKCD